MSPAHYSHLGFFNLAQETFQTAIHFVFDEPYVQDNEQKHAERHHSKHGEKRAERVDDFHAHRYTAFARRQQHAGGKTDSH